MLSFEGPLQQFPSLPLCPIFLHWVLKSLLRAGMVSKTLWLEFRDSENGSS